MNARRLRILIDARMLIGRFSGVSRVVTRLVEHLALDDRFQVVALCGDRCHEPWNHRTDVEQLITNFTKRDRSPYRRLRWEATQLARSIRAARPDVYHATWNSGVPAFCPVPAILTLHDLIPWNEPRPPMELWSYRRAVRASARRAWRITTVSEFVRGEVLRTLRVKSSKVLCVPNGVDRAADRRQAVDANEAPYVLYVGGHEPRKNVAAVLSAMRRYWATFGDSMRILLTGAFENLEPAAAAVLNTFPADAPIEFLGDPDDEELGRRYRGATALLLLSKAEGFGLPALEAMAHGCPVIAARFASLPEVVADAGLLVDPDDSRAVATAIHHLTTEVGLRADLVRRGMDRADRASWASVARQYGQLYLDAVAGSSAVSSSAIPGEVKSANSLQPALS